MTLPPWFTRRFQMTPEAEFRWQRNFRKPVGGLAVAGAILVVAGLLPNMSDRYLVLFSGVAALAGCVLIRLLVADGGRQ